VYHEKKVICSGTEQIPKMTEMCRFMQNILTAKNAITIISVIGRKMKKFVRFSVFGGGVYHEEKNNRFIITGMPVGMHCFGFLEKSARRESEISQNQCFL
jgi:hypothetical protein